MATQAYYTWVRSGRNFERPAWIAEMKTLAAAHGVGFLGDLGDESHLQADNPLDHTPFSTDEWPVSVSQYRIHAVDFKAGPWCSKVLADARVGKLPWLKYMIFLGFSYSARSGWVAKPSADLHCHMSGRTDYPVNQGLNGYNPFISQETEMLPLAPGQSGEPVRRMQIKVVASGGHVGPVDATGKPVNHPSDNNYNYCTGIYNSDTVRGLGKMVGNAGTIYSAWEDSALDNLIIDKRARDLIAKATAPTQVVIPKFEVGPFTLPILPQ
jgi:hypothetical protein